MRNFVSAVGLEVPTERLFAPFTPIAPFPSPGPDPGPLKADAKKTENAKAAPPPKSAANKVVRPVFLPFFMPDIFLLSIPIATHNLLWIPAYLTRDGIFLNFVCLWRRVPTRLLTRSIN